MKHDNSLNIFEMRHRQLFNDVGDGLFGKTIFSYCYFIFIIIFFNVRIKSFFEY